jgi:exonuclease SbcD
MWLAQADPTIPIILTAHASVQGAIYGAERTIMLGADLVLPGSLVRDPRLDYVALGHIHKSQNLNENAHPPVIYPGSIERVDFGEAADDKYFVIADISRGKSVVHWRKLEHIRPFIDLQVSLLSPDGITETLRSTLASAGNLQGAVIRLTVDYDRQWDALIDESALHNLTEPAFEFHLVKLPRIASRIRLPGNQAASSLTPLELLDQYWLASHTAAAETEVLLKMAKDIIDQES